MSSRRTILIHGPALWAVGAALLAQSTGCTEWHGWPQANRDRSAVNDSSANQLAGATQDEDALRSPSGDTDADEAERVTSPDSVEARIQDYIQHFSQKEQQANQDGVTTELAAADGRSDAREPLPTSGGSAAQQERIVGVREPSALIRPSTSPEEPFQPTGDPLQRVGAANQPTSVNAHVQAAPVVLSVSVEPDLLWEERTSATPTSVGPATPNTGAEVSVLASPNDIGTMIERLEARAAKNPNDLEAQVRLKLLYIVAGEEQKALGAPEGLAEQTAELLRGLAEIILHTRNAATDLSRGADSALQAAEAFAGRLRRHAQLSIPRVVLCRRVDSYGLYDPIDPPSFAAGKPVSAVVYTELGNFRSEPDETGMYGTRLSQRIELLDGAGQRVWHREDKNVVDVCHNQRRDFFLAPIIHLPADLEPGTYHLRVEVQDHLSGKFTSATTPLTILASGAG